MDRFQPPTHAEEIAASFQNCEGCGARTHCDDLDEKNLCADCGEENDED